MSNGVYGLTVPSNITADDIDIFYSYSPSRNSDDMVNSEFEKLDSNLLTPTVLNTKVNSYDTVVEGVHNLKLPLSKFNKKGFYNVYIKPKEIPVVIQDVAPLISYPDVRGLVIDSTSVPQQFQKLFKTNNELVGYRVVYFNDNGEREDFYRLVTSNNKVEPTIQNRSNDNQKAVRYRYNESSTLSFVTVTPSTSSTFKPNAIPFIGKPAQKCLFVNTKFEPILLEIEMVTNDADTLATMIDGSQLRSLENGLITTYNDNNEIFSQHEAYTIKDQYTGTPIYEVRKNKGGKIDHSQTISDK